MYPAFFRQITMQNNETTIGFERLVQRIEHLLTASLYTRLRGLFDGLARDGETISMQVTTLQKSFHQKRNATCRVHICCHVFTERLDICNERHTRADDIKVVNVQVDVCFARQSQKVENCI